MLNVCLSQHFSGSMFLSASGRKLPSWSTRSSTAVYRRTLARLLTLTTYQVAEGFALPAATASSSLRFTVPLSAAEHFRLLALEYGTTSSSSSSLSFSLLRTGKTQLATQTRLQSNSSQYMSLYSNRVIKFLSLRCPI